MSICSVGSTCELRKQLIMEVILDSIADWSLCKWYNSYIKHKQLGSLKHYKNYPYIIVVDLVINNNMFFCVIYKTVFFNSANVKFKFLVWKIFSKNSE